MSLTNQRRLQMESLERRELMAGNVYISYKSAGHDLVITGDSKSNYVLITQPIPGQILVSGRAWDGGQTQVWWNNQPHSSMPCRLYHNVTVNLGAGNDRLDFGIGDNVINVPGSLKFNGGSGDDEAMVCNTKTGGNMWLATGSGQDITKVVGATTGGSLWAYDGVGTLNQGDRDTATFTGCTTRLLGTQFNGTNSGSDHVRIEGSAADAVWSSLGDGDDNFDMVNTRMTGNFRVWGGNGYDKFNVPIANGFRYYGDSFEKSFNS